MKTLIEIHALQNFAPSNLNRDDTGAPKDALFGGTRRARISSQCLKRAVRQDFGRKKDEGFFRPDELAVRTKRLYQAIADRLKEEYEEAEILAKAEIALSYVKLKAGDGGKTQYLFEYDLSPQLRLAGFPVPICAFQFEDGGWSDFPATPLFACLALLTNVVACAVVAVLPLLLISFLFLGRKTPEGEKMGERR